MKTSRVEVEAIRFVQMREMGTRLFFRQVPKVALELAFLMIVLGCESALVEFVETGDKHTNRSM